MQKLSFLYIFLISITLACSSDYFNDTTLTTKTVSNNQKVFVSDSVTILKFDSRIEFMDIGLDPNIIRGVIESESVLKLKSIEPFDSTSLFVRTQGDKHYVFILRKGSAKPVQYNVIGADSIPAITEIINMNDTISIGWERTTFIQYKSRVLSVTDSSNNVFFDIDGTNQNLLLLKCRKEDKPFNATLYVQEMDKLYKYNIRSGTSEKMYYKAI
jgi:hypothetical protein